MAPEAPTPPRRRRTAWTLRARRRAKLSFEPLGEPCGVRRTLFASGAWERQP